MLSYMEYIYAVYKEQGFSRAAQKLYVSQPWLSSVVKREEQEIHLPLFNRSTNPISLTEAGRIYMENVEKILAIKENMKNQFAEMSAEGSVQLNIGSSMFFCTYVLPRVLDDFQREHPEITLGFSEGESGFLTQKLQEGKLDLLLDAEEAGEAGIDSMLWACEHLVLAVPAEYAINEKLKSYRYSFEELLNENLDAPAKPPVPLEKFAGEKFLMLQKGNDSFRRIHTICSHAGFQPQVSMYLEQMMTSYYLVCEGQGVAFLRSSIPQYVMPTDKICFYRLGDELARRNIYISYKSRGTTAVQKKLLEYMQSRREVVDRQPDSTDN